MSVLLFGIITTGITIKEINFVFVKLNNPNHDYLFLFLWSIFFYFILRYNHYLRAVGMSEMEIEVKRVFQNKIAKYLAKKSDLLSLEKFDTTKHTNNFDRFEETHALHNVGLINSNLYEFEIAVSIVGHKDDGRTDTISSTLLHEVVDYRKFKIMRLRSWIEVSMKNFHFLEFYLPNAMAVVTYIFAIPEFIDMVF